MISKTKIKTKTRRKTNQENAELIRDLIKQKNKLWLDVAKYISRPKRKSVSVNIEKINKLSKDSELVVVPGKVLGKGNLDHHIVIAALKFSSDAKKKLSEKGSLMSIQQLLKKYDDFKNIKVKIII